MSAKWFLVICGGGKKVDMSPDPRIRDRDERAQPQPTRTPRSLACPHAVHNAQMDYDVLPFEDEKFV